MQSSFYLPLMNDNVTRHDLDVLVKFLQQDPIPRLTNGPKCREFEEAWSKWVGVKHSLFVGSGSAANILTMLALRECFPDGRDEIICAPLTWVSDFASIMHAGLKPVTCDINLTNLSFDIEKLKAAITPQTKAILLTHVLGLNALTDELLEICEKNNIHLIEDVCESHGATFKGKKAGGYGFASNFSFFMAHHLTSLAEGGMICTNDTRFYNYLRAFRSHSMVREMDDPQMRQEIIDANPELNKDFIFLAPAYNARSNEPAAVVALNQMKRLDAQNEERRDNLEYFLSNLSPTLYHTALDLNGQSAYGLILILKENNKDKWAKVEQALREYGFEFRRGCSGGGSQIKQPYFKKYLSDNGLTIDETQFPNLEHIHNCSAYLGNYPGLERHKVDNLLRVLNSIA